MTKMMADFSAQRSLNGNGAYEVIDNSKLCNPDGSFNSPETYMVADGLTKNKARYMARKLNDQRDGKDREKMYQSNFEKWFIGEFLNAGEGRM